MNLRFFPVVELSSSHQTTNKCNQNIERSYRLSQSNKFCNGCFLFDPKELGPKIERPSAPSTYNINKYNFFEIHRSEIQSFLAIILISRLKKICIIALYLEFTKSG